MFGLTTKKYLQEKYIQDKDNKINQNDKKITKKFEINKFIDFRCVQSISRVAILRLLIQVFHRGRRGRFLLLHVGVECHLRGFPRSARVHQSASAVPVVRARSKHF